MPMLGCITLLILSYVLFYLLADNYIVKVDVLTDGLDKQDVINFYTVGLKKFSFYMLLILTILGTSSVLFLNRLRLIQKSISDRKN